MSAWCSDILALCCTKILEKCLEFKKRLMLLICIAHICAVEYKYRKPRDETVCCFSHMRKTKEAVGLHILR